jgi:hypothetical protein
MTIGQPGETTVSDLAQEFDVADTREVAVQVTGLCTAYGAKRIVARGEGLNDTVLTAWGASLVRRRLTERTYRP